MIKKRTVLLILSALLLLASGVLIYSCSTVPLTGRSRIDLVSHDAILTSSFQQYSEFISKAPRSRNAEQSRRVQEIGKRIALATDKYMRSVGLSADADKYRWEFNLIASPEVNAFCMPGGKIVVYEGILPVAANDDQLATVIGHEVAHAIAKHSNERLSHQILRQYGANALSMATRNNSVILRQVTGAIYGIGTEVAITLPYSRQHEFEADKIGLYLMALAGYDYTQAEDFWVRMSSGSGRTSDFLSTHPSSERRIQAIREEIPNVHAFMGRGGTPATDNQVPVPASVNTLNEINKGRRVPIKTNY